MTSAADGGGPEIMEAIARRRAALEAGNDPPAAARQELGEALWTLLEAVTGSRVGESEYRSLATVVRSLATRWSTLPEVAAAMGPAQAIFAGMEDFHDRSPLVGRANPIAPPMRLDPEMRDGEVHGEVSFGKRHEGAPGCVHGGFLAAALDEALGVSCIFSGHPGMTGELKIQYRSPTPILTRLDVTARFDRQEARRIYTTGEIRAGSRVTCRAEGLFIAIGAEKFEELQKRRDGNA